MDRPMKTIIHVNQHVIRRNKTHDENEAPLTVRRGRTTARGHQVVIRDASGDEVARVVYRPHKPLSCGARVWIETENIVESLDI